MSTQESLSPKDELSIIQDIISAQEEICFKYFGWALGLVTALSVGYAHNSVSISCLTYFVSGLFILVSCAFSARKHKVAQQKAINRFSEVEKQAKNLSYQGFAIDESLNQKTYSPKIKPSFSFYIPYLMLGIVVISFILFKPNS